MALDYHLHSKNFPMSSRSDFLFGLWSSFWSGAAIFLHIWVVLFFFYFPVDGAVFSPHFWCFPFLPFHVFVHNQLFLLFSELNVYVFICMYLCIGDPRRHRFAAPHKKERRRAATPTRGGREQHHPEGHDSRRRNDVRTNTRQSANERLRNPLPMRPLVDFGEGPA